jgi:stringent starvation protein B
LLRAFYDWILDNRMTPYIVVDATLPGVDVPDQYVEDGRIILNINPSAVRDLSLGNDHLSFNARFSGVPCSVYAPIRAVTAVYAKENGRGMVFKDDEEEGDPPPENTKKSSTTKAPSTKEGKNGKDGGRPNLTLVK